MNSAHRTFPASASESHNDSAVIATHHPEDHSFAHAHFYAPSTSDFELNAAGLWASKSHNIGLCPSLPAHYPCDYHQQLRTAQALYYPAKDRQPHQQSSPSWIASHKPGYDQLGHTRHCSAPNSVVYANAADWAHGDSDYHYSTSTDWAHPVTAATPRKIQQHTYRPYACVQPQPDHTSAAFAALRDMAIDHHASTTVDDVPDLFSSRQSTISSHGRNTPMTPRPNTSDESDDKSAKPTNGIMRPPPVVSMNGYSRLANAEYQRGHVELYRTESAACQDELFNPANFDTSATSQPPAQPAKIDTSPKGTLAPTSQGNLVSERIKTANDVRTQSPKQDISRERSPFRKGAEEAPNNNYSRTAASAMPSAASIRQREKEQADRKEYEKHQPPLRREETKTISPKDAVLDYDTEHPNSGSMFNDVIPEGYQKHFGGTESYSNNFVSGTSQAFGQFVPMNQNVGGFRGVDLNNFLQSPMPDTAFNQPPTSTQESERPPEFPAQLTSMESSASDAPISSQESATSPTIKRPANTSANTGTYTCTAANCTLRFDTSAKLQRHRREAHPAPNAGTQHLTPSVSRSSAGTSATPDASEMDGVDEDDLGTNLSSSALLARNSQTGPHKCSRINPTTGKPCNTIFSRPYDLTRHEDTIHNKTKHKVQCQYCTEEKSFSRNDALTRHMRVVHPEVEFQVGKRGKLE